MLKSGVNIQYLRALVRGEALHQFDTFSVEVGIYTPENLTSIILGLGTHFFPFNALLKKKRAMRHGMRKPRGFKIRCCYDRLVGLNEYFSVFPG